MLDTLPPFPGFRDEALDFLRSLKKHNRRDWFKPRKQVYDDEVKGPMECLVADAARRMSEAGLPLTGDPKRSRFRIYRDTRFSNDKRPYKAHTSAVFTRTGDKKDNGVVYVHVEPGSSFLGAGFYHCKARFLRPVRQAMVDDPDGYRMMLDRLEANGLPLGDDDEALTGMPRGFADYRDDPLADHLRHQNLLVRRPLDPELLATPALADAVVQMTRDSLPLLEYVWQAHGE